MSAPLAQRTDFATERLECTGPLPPEKFASAHLVGICGSGMKALAEMLRDLGCRVTGSDAQPPGPAVRTLQRRGFRVHQGHHGRFVPHDVDVLIHSPAVSGDNPEVALARQNHVPVVPYSRMLGLLMQTRTGVSIAGTHGKSTTTALTASILQDAGLSPSAVIGAELVSPASSGWAGDGDLLVVESCEYRRHFLELAPRFAAVTGVEPDHFDCYRDFEETRTAFEQFAGRVAEDGVLLLRGDCPASASLRDAATAEVLTFSTRPGCDWWAADCRRAAAGTWFRVFHRGHFFSEIHLPLPGRHNILNALAAIALSHYAGAPVSAIRESLRTFPGLRRRFERIGSWRGISLIDDYAHHPTAVRGTLEAAREDFGERRIWCAFQPHQVSRTQALMAEFVGSFEPADSILVAPVYAAREATTEAETTSRELAGRIVQYGRPARFIPSLDRLIATVEDEARPGDVLITMGAGDIDRVHHELTRRLQRHYPPR